MDKTLIFNLKHLDGFKIIENCGRDEVRCNRNMLPKHLFVDGKHNRWIIPLRAISRKNADMLIKNYLEGERMLYIDAAAYFLDGVLWENHVFDYIDLPMKMEMVSVVFDMIEDEIKCISLTVFSKGSNNPTYNSANDIINNMLDFKKILMDGK